MCTVGTSSRSPSIFSSSYSYLIILLSLREGWSAEPGDLLPEAEQLDGGSERVRQGAGGDARRGQGLVPQGRGQLCPQRLGGGQGRACGEAAFVFATSSVALSNSCRSMKLSADPYL
jgi:hypothetical protein